MSYFGKKNEKEKEKENEKVITKSKTFYEIKGDDNAPFNNQSVALNKKKHHKKSIKKKKCC